MKVIFYNKGFKLKDKDEIDSDSKWNLKTKEKKTLFQEPTIPKSGLMIKWVIERQDMLKEVFGE